MLTGRLPSNLKSHSGLLSICVRASRPIQRDGVTHMRTLDLCENLFANAYALVWAQALVCVRVCVCMCLHHPVEELRVGQVVSWLVLRNGSMRAGRGVDEGVIEC